MYDTRIKLIRRTESGRDKYGNIIHAEEEKERWAEVKSVSRAEYYQAATTGMQPTVVIVLSDRRDYEGQSHVVINGRGICRRSDIRERRNDRNHIDGA